MESRPQNTIENYFKFLGIVLFGYALGGKGFAYIGYRPAFIGEATLAFGIAVLFTMPGAQKVFRSLSMWLVLLFMVWGAERTYPYYPIYGLDAIRDAITWIYGCYAFIIFALLMHDPTRILVAVRAYKKLIVPYLCIAPFMWLISQRAYDILPMWPGSDVPIILVKGGDLVVHFTAIMAVMSVYSGLNRPRLSMFMLAVNMLINLLNRASMVTFFAGMFVTNLLRPFNRTFVTIVLCLGLGLGFFWAFNVKLDIVGDRPRTISVDQFVDNVVSIFDSSKTKSEELSGTREWRLRWWNTIIGYTFHGKYYWTGKGFGINLAEDDGFRTQEDNMLRSPHNGHMTILARMGVPGLAMWVLLNLSWVMALFDAWYRSTKANRMQWSSLFTVLIVYWVALMINTSFDVYLEGPVGGVWFWTIFGTGLACAHIYRRHPNLLDELADDVQVRQHPKLVRRSTFATAR